MKKPIAIAALVAILILPIAAYLMTVQLSDKTDSELGLPARSDESTAQPSTSNQDPVEPADAISASEVILKTNKGDIRLTLYPDAAPLTVKNFVTLGKRGYYNEVTFHRVIQDFMIQAGDPTGSGAGGESIYGPRFKDEINDRKIVAGTLAMANAGSNTNGSQFFIVTEQPQPHLDGRHTAFGQVADEASMAIVRAIAAVPVSSTDKPLEPVTIVGFEIVQ